MAHCTSPDSSTYSGYIDVEARHLFFWFFESRSDPDKDDVIFWVNGGLISFSFTKLWILTIVCVCRCVGPGGSSAMGLFYELGPCRISGANSTTFHPESWNSNANIFFVDQPVSVGFSYAEYGETVSTTEEAAVDIAAFVAIFFEHFSKLKGRPFHMAGESFGGRYIPLFAAEVYDQNSRLEKAGLTPVNLQSIMIGDGYTDFYTMIPSYYDMTCTATSAAPVLDIACKKWLKESCVDVFDTIGCGAATSFCDSITLNVSSLSLDPDFVLTFNKGVNPYDITKKCDGEFAETLCYPAFSDIETYLNLPEVREVLGTDPEPATFKYRSDTIGINFHRTLDQFHTSYHHVAALLDRGVRALIYNGDVDWICNHLANEKWTLELEWHGHEEFSTQPLREWSVDGKKAGETRSAKGLTFATIKGAGHLAPFDKPKETLELVNRWIGGQEL
ncbi:hypothetical protein CVT25_015124 [Psilocybe cyanescens]|uniref:carboxypeptidase C n=1 Tax=Psilocybe cyanescens TaxID=93625 RepID=A0A409X257_PSICY|nr:hypothetical protein CVT25_015124 [Psilocybe cyanescens]